MNATVLDARLQRSLDDLHARQLHRVRRVVEGVQGVRVRVDGRDCINFCSNDYLGLAADPRLAAAAQAALDRCGTGAGASALVSGYNREHQALEAALAEFTGRPRALLFSSGWAANLGVLRALLGRQDTLIADELNHASLIDGGRLSGARYVRVAHADLDGFAAALNDAEGGGGDALRLVATDAVFSMDGDIADLPELSRLCAEQGAALMVDDAHGFGVLGAGGRGAVECLHTPADIHVATFGKALGCAGAFVAGSEKLIDYLIQRARSWVFSTAPPPALSAAAHAALAIVAGDEGRQLRGRLYDNIHRFQCAAARRGIAERPGVSGATPIQPTALMSAQVPIQPLILGDAGRTMAVSRALFERGYWVAGIRPPTVPAGSARLRITLSAAHTPEQIDGLVDALAEALDAAFTRTCSGNDSRTVGAAT